MAFTSLVVAAYESSDDDAPSDDGPLLSANSSSERADSCAADDAFDAAVETQIQRAADDAAAAELHVRDRLVACGVVGHAAMSLMASSIDELRLVAFEVLGNDISDLHWTVLRRLWSDAMLPGRREVLEKTRTFFDANGHPVFTPPPPTNVAPVCADATTPLALYVKDTAAASPQLYTCSLAASAVLATTTHMVLAASTSGSKRSKTETPLPPMVRRCRL